MEKRELRTFSFLCRRICKWMCVLFGILLCVCVCAELYVSKFAIDHCADDAGGGGISANKTTAMMLMIIQIM